MGNPLRPGVPDLNAVGWAEYGHRRGIHRILDVLGRQGVSATINVSGIMAERYPEIVRRIGIISINTALEMDLSGNINSTHVMGSSMMNGIGGSGDFTRNAYISIFTCPSVAKEGRISAIVPLVTHGDHNEHSVQVVITEQGVADMRGKSPAQRSQLIIEKCAHPDYREMLREYVRLEQKGHTKQSLEKVFAMHVQLLKTGAMHGTDWHANEH